MDIVFRRILIQSLTIRLLVNIKCQNDPILCCDQWLSHDQQWLMNGLFSRSS